MFGLKPSNRTFVYYNFQIVLVVHLVIPVARHTFAAYSFSNSDFWFLFSGSDGYKITDYVSVSWLPLKDAHRQDE